MKQTIETKADAGCPLFFSPKCKVRIADNTFQYLCLDNYKKCRAYQKIERRCKS